MAALVGSLLLAAPAAAGQNGYVVVHPGNMHGWAFVSESGTGGGGQMVSGPAGQPLGVGSAELALESTADGWALATGNHDGTMIASITSLNYSTYTRNTNAISLQLAFSGPTYHRLVFEPSNNAAVTPNHWQQWTPTAPTARWWITRSTTVCTQASLCTWLQINTMFPAATITGGVWLKAGSGWSAGSYNVDGFTFDAANQRAVTYDFEPSRNGGSD